MHFGQFAVGGYGMVFTESTYVEAHARNHPDCLALYSSEHEAGLRKVISFVNANSDAKFCVQLCHAGRKAAHKPLWDGGGGPLQGEDRFPTYAPSVVALKEGFPIPLEMTATDIQTAIESFQRAAKRAAAAGADCIELHGAHGYLVHQFLSPLSNQRTDSYGGSLRNRMRFGLELFEAVRAVWPANKPMGVRISATDWVNGGWDVEGSIAFVKALEALRCDYLHVSSGGNSPLQQIEPGPGYQTVFANAIRSEVTMKIITVGHQAHLRCRPCLRSGPEG